MIRYKTDRKFKDFTDVYIDGIKRYFIKKDTDGYNLYTSFPNSRYMGTYLNLFTVKGFIEESVKKELAEVKAA